MKKKNQFQKKSYNWVIYMNFLKIPIIDYTSSVETRLATKQNQYHLVFMKFFEEFIEEF
jgi:hypothetical protein